MCLNLEILKTLICEEDGKKNEKLSRKKRRAQHCARGRTMESDH